MPRTCETTTICAPGEFFGNHKQTFRPRRAVRGISPEEVIFGRLYPSNRVLITAATLLSVFSLISFQLAMEVPQANLPSLLNSDSHPLIDALQITPTPSSYKSYLPFGPGHIPKK